MSFMDCCDWSACTLCGQCLVQCPVMEMNEEEAKREFGLLLKGEPAPRVFNECTLCFDCNNFCPEGLRPYELILQRITDANKERGSVPALLPYALNGMPPPQFFQDLYGELSFGEKEILRRWSEPPPPSKDVLFIGCFGKVLCHDIENSLAMRQLPKFGPTDICCGELHYRGGMWEAYVDITEKTLARFQNLDVERVVCYCSSCYNFFSNILPKVYGKRFPFELTSLYQWLLEKLEAGVLEVKRPLKFRAAIHESCYVSELGPDFYEALRKLYRAAGAEIVELGHNRERALSCGAASIVRGFRPRNVVREQNRKFREVKAVGTREMAVNCPGCYYTLGLSSWLRGIKVRYMLDELLRALGDDISIPAGKRFSMILKTSLKRAPLALKAVDPVLPRIQP